MIAPRGRDTLGILVKAPIPGRVKTRLAAELGAEQATELYRALGRSVVAACVDPGYHTVVWYTPAAARAAVRGWLQGVEPLAFRPQVRGGLGVRLGAAFARHFGEGVPRVILVGSDCPGVERGVITQAFAALDRYDLVLGPAHDGGYYLIGLRSTTRGGRLFHGVSWSTPDVLRQTLLAARRLGLRPALLPVLRDVDTVADARATGLLGLDVAELQGRYHEQVEIRDSSLEGG